MSDPLTERQREYREVYLRSEHWQQIRQAALGRAGHRCQVCNVTGGLDVHHRTYERLGHEEPGDLTVLCRDCHATFHGSGQRPTPAPSKRKKRRRKKGAHRKGDLARDLAAMKRRNEAQRLTYGPMTVEPVGHIESRGYILSIATDEYEVRVFAANNGRSLRVWAVPGTEMVENGKARPMEPWAWYQEMAGESLDAELDARMARET